MKLSTVALVLAPVLAAEHYLIVDPSKIDACNILQARFAFTKMVSLLFNSDSLSGNSALTHEAIKDPNVWRRVNALSPKPRSGFLSSDPARGDCEDVDTLIEVATTIGAGFASGEMSTEELGETILDLVDSHVRTLEVSQLDVTPETLREEFYTKGVTTPLLTIVPSCTKLPFELPPRGTDFDWAPVLKTKAKPLAEDIWSRFDSCSGCLNEYVRVLTQIAEVQVSENVVTSMVKTAKSKVEGVLNDMSSKEEGDLPHSLGELLAYSIAYLSQANANAGKLKTTAQLSSHAENLVAFLDALNHELVDGNGPILSAMEKLYKAVGCA